MESNRPNGRKKHVTGQGNDVHKRGEGLNTGPVGRKDGYQNRPQGGSASNQQSFQSTQRDENKTGSSMTRAGGMGLGGIAILVIAFLLFKMCSGGGSNLLGGLSDDGGSGTVQQQSSQSGGLFSGVLESLMSGGTTGSSSVSSSWISGLNNTTSNEPDRTVASGSRAKRTQILGDNRDVITIMIYMCGTDLESKSGMATNDLQEMINAKFGTNVNIIVYTGGCKQWKNTTVSSSVNQIYKLESGGLRQLVGDAGRSAMTDPATLVSFIDFCKQNYPANRYDLIFWDHGGGSVSGYGYDEKNASAGSMTLKGINEALQKAQINFDFIGFDACLMATLETGLMLEPYADYLVASEETEPGVGWYYTDWLTELGKNTSMSTLDIGKNIVDGFISECNRQCPGQKTTLSVVDLAELGNTVEAKFSDFAVATSEQIKSDFQTVSDARSGAREFATSSKIDQIDLVHLAYNLGTEQSKALANAILGAVKYNKTSSNMSNCYGISIFFPYRKSSKVDSAVATYAAIGMDSAYSRCIQQFASMGVAGQAVGQSASANGVSSPISSLLGGSSAGTGSLPDIGGLLGGLLGGGDMLSGLTGGSSDFFGKSIDDSAATVDYLSKHQFDPNNLVWKTANGETVMELPEEQWNLVHDLELNVFFNDGEGFIDLGLDNAFTFTNKGELVGEYDGNWLAIDNNFVAYYFEDVTNNGDNRVITGRVPVMLNGERAELIIVFESAKDDVGYIAGARTVYAEDETETVAKSFTELEVGDKIDFICDYYDYAGNYVDTYMFGEQIEYTGNNTVSDITLDSSKTMATYLFTDIYCQEYWTPVMP